MEISDLDKIRVIISLQKLYIKFQCWDFSTHLRNVGRVINFHEYNSAFTESQELNWNEDRFYHVGNFDLEDYNFATHLIKKFCGDDAKEMQKLINLLDNNKGMWRNIKIDKILK